MDDAGTGGAMAEGIIVEQMQEIGVMKRSLQEKLSKAAPAGNDSSLPSSQSRRIS